MAAKRDLSPPAAPAAGNLPGVHSEVPRPWRGPRAGGQGGGDAAGPLDRKTCELIKVGICIAGGWSRPSAATSAGPCSTAQRGRSRADDLAGHEYLRLPRTVAAWQWARQQMDTRPAEKHRLDCLAWAAHRFGSKGSGDGLLGLLFPFVLASGDTGLLQCGLVFGRSIDVDQGSRAGATSLSSSAVTRRVRTSSQSVARRCNPVAMAAGPLSRGAGDTLPARGDPGHPRAAGQCQTRRLAKACGDPNCVSSSGTVAADNEGGCGLPV